MPTECQRVDDDLKADLLRRLAQPSPAQTIAPVIVVLLNAMLLLDLASPAGLAGWVTVVIMATAGRWYVSNRLATDAIDPVRSIHRFRLVVLMSAVSWAAGPLLVLQSTPFEDLAVLAMVYAGLVAAATATLVADRVSFHIFNTILLLPLVVAFIAGTPGAPHYLPAVFVVLFGTMAALLHRDAHRRVVALLETGRKLAISERQTAREKSYLNALFRSAPAAIVTITDGARVLDVNPAFENLFGFSVEEARGRQLNELIVPADLTMESQDIDRQLATTGAVSLETRRVRRDGKPIDVAIAGANATGEASGTGFVIYTDITDRKRVENELREHEARYRLLVESMSDLVWQVDVEGRWTFLNAATLDIYGQKPEQMIGRSVFEFSSAERRADDVARFERMLGGEMMLDYETVHEQADGSQVHLSFAGRPVRDADFTVIGAQGTARDVTTRVRVRAQLDRARHEAERTAAARSAFVANVSHEIRTPMNGVIGMTDLLLDSELQPEQRRSVDLIRTSAEALLAVINDILDYSKIEAGHMTVDEETYDLHGLVDTAVRLLAVRASEKQIELNYEIAPVVPRWVRGDPGRLRQILNNLVGNAIKFTERGSVFIAVSAVEEAGACRLTFRIRDTGIGIPADTLSTIFEEFSQADMTTTRRFGGTGLGLAIARRLARLLGGDIGVTSEAGRGSEFVATILVTEAERGTQPDAPAGTVLTGLRALVVDDNRTNRRIFRDMLRAAGMTVARAASAGAAMELLSKAARSGLRVDVALIDTQMPDRDGFDLARDVRSDRTFDETRLIMLTSAGRPGDGQRCRELGIDAYLTKPFPRAELLEAIAAVTVAPAEQSGRGLITRHSIEETRRRLDILLVEDNPVNREVASTMLRRRGHGVDIAVNGQEALDAVAARRYDLVLMDIQMPVLDGLAATARIRAMPDRKGLAIIALTAHALASEMTRCFDAGMDGYLSKPFRPHELFAMVEGWGHSSADGPATSDSLEPIDLAGFRSQLVEAGIEDALEGLLATFANDAPGRVEALTLACAGDRVDEIGRTAHALKSASGAIGARPLSDLLQRIEHHAREGDGDAARRLLPEVQSAAAAALDTIGRLATAPH